MAEVIRQAWRNYSDPEVDILAFSQEEPHHTVIPIARKRQGQFELDLVLRDNHTSEQFPDGGLPSSCRCSAYQKGKYWPD